MSQGQGVRSGGQLAQSQDFYIRNQASFRMRNQFVWQTMIFVFSAIPEYIL